MLTDTQSYTSIHASKSLHHNHPHMQSTAPNNLKWRQNQVYIYDHFHVALYKHAMIDRTHA